MKSTVGLVMVVVSLGVFGISLWISNSLLMVISFGLFFLGVVFYIHLNRLAQRDSTSSSIYTEAMTDSAEWRVEDEWGKKDKMKDADTTSMSDDPRD
ncbi:hypothetical protein K6Q96_11005 [Grimontia kaedaensis]|uniref:Uncharacterized protein n=1 Tax=Grimontia kaedaensis TaxID=2872157 RepID=A0ABY4WU60_9GAMM|nr:hypothetical protein [Grimontia kaedaensis]USH01440.1 hypothetical protein K6Q96_11005 [Grimontia kaedaensis]